MPGRRGALVPREVTLNLDELRIPEGHELPPRTAQVVALRILGLSTDEISNQLVLQPSTVRKHLMIARQRGKLSDVSSFLDHAAVPRAVENLMAGLEEGDKDYTLEVLKGRGAFRSHSHQASTGSTGPMHLEITVSVPQGIEQATVVEGQVMGKRRG